MSTDAIQLLSIDHRAIKQAFTAFEQAHERGDETGMGAAVDSMIELLTVHTYLENEIMYPRVRELLPELEEDILESFEEHHVADVLILELVSMKPSDERYAAKTTVLIENVTHHIDEEEEGWFPQVRGGLTTVQLEELGAEMAAAKQKAPRKPSQPGALKKTIDAIVG